MGAVPAPFGFGLWTSHFSPAILGCPTVVLPKFDAGLALDLIEREKVTVLCCVSTQFIMLLNEQAERPRDLSSLRCMFTGGEAVPYRRAAEFEHLAGERAGDLDLGLVGFDRAQRLIELNGVADGDTPAGDGGVLQSLSEIGDQELPVHGCSSARSTQSSNRSTPGSQAFSSRAGGYGVSKPVARNTGASNS